MRKEILKLGAGWVLCAAAFAACGAEQTITHKGLGFEITAPDNEKSSSRLVQWRGNKYVAEVEVYDPKENDGLRSFFGIPSVQAILKGATVIDIAIIRLDGRNAIKLTVDHTGNRSTFYYTVARTRGYVIWMGAHKDIFDEASKEFDAIVASFKIIDSK